MTEMAVSVENLSKKYKLGDIHTNLLSERLTNLVRGRRHYGGDGRSDLWALRDVTFQLEQGQVLGIVGRNGSGKSTLLKILSRLTSPTTGRAVVRGRLASLLEVGTGFHPELSGRENIYLNGTILGMRRAEINRKFDEIVAFAGVERFLDTPVKRYSSGMYVRLAFAVAAHVEAEILVVDEVLAVGDAEFQKRCMGKMGEVARAGRTVLFVSHNMAALRNLCTMGLYLDRGDVIRSGTAEECISLYETRNAGAAASTWERVEERTAPLTITSIGVGVTGSQPALSLQVDISLRSTGVHKPAIVAIDIAAAGTVLMQAIPRLEGFLSPATAKHDIHVTVDLPPLIPGQYAVNVWAGSNLTETLDEVKEEVSFEVYDSPTAARTLPHTRDHGYVVPTSRVHNRNELESGR